MLEKNKNAAFMDYSNLGDTKAANLNNSIGKLFEQFGSSEEYKINMDDRICMHCWITKSTLYCSTCMCFYCASCAHMNHVSAGSYHDIISVHHLSISRTDTAKSLQEKQKNHCKRHKNKELTYCCTSCNYMLICETCIIIDGHGSHLLLTLAEAIPRGRQILLQSLSSLNTASFFMSQKISEISSLAEQRKAIFENNLLNVEDTQKSLTRAISSEEQLLFTEINLLASKLNRGGEDICKSCVDLKELLVSVCGEVSIILQLAKESPSHSLNRYVKISNVVKGTLDSAYRVLVPELQHLSVPYWNLFPEIIDDVLNDTNKYTQEHIDHAMKLSDAITKIASGDISVVENIGPINVQVYAQSKNQNDRAARAKVHKIFTSKLKMIQNEKLKNVQNPLIAPKSSLKLDSKNKPKSKAAQTGPKLQEWLGLRDWKNNQSKKQTSAKNKNLPAYNIITEGNHSSSKNKSIFHDFGLIRALSDGDIKVDEIVEKDIEIMTIGRDKKLEAIGRTKEEKLKTEEFYESQIHFTGTLMGACTYTKKEDGSEVLKMDYELTQINIKYCFPFIVFYDTSNTGNQNSKDSSIKENSNIIDKAHSIKGGIEYKLPTISPGLERIDIPIILGKIEKPKNSLFVADIRQSNIRIQSIHSNSITPETSKFLGAAANSWKPIEDGFEISNVIRGNTIDSWVFSCPDFNTAEKWISMLKGEDPDVKSCIQKIGTARLCIKSLNNKRNNVKISKSKLTENLTGSNDSQAFIDVVPNIPNNTREKLLISTQPDRHELTQTIVYEDDEGEYYEEQEIDLPDVMSIRLDRKLSAKKTKSLEKLMIPSILKVGKEPVIQIEKLNVLGSSLNPNNLQVVVLTKNRLYITSTEIFEKNLSHDLLLDEYSINEKCFTETIRLSDSSNPDNTSKFSMISSNLREPPTKNDNSPNSNNFGFEYRDHNPNLSSNNITSKNSNTNHSDKAIITFICPTKDSELIWLDFIHNHNKKKPLKYWRQILDGIIVRHRRTNRSPKSPKGSKLSKHSSMLSRSRNRSSTNNIFEESDRFTDTSIYNQKSDLGTKNHSYKDNHHASANTQVKKSNDPITTHSEGQEHTSTSDPEKKSNRETPHSKINLESSNHLKNVQNSVKFNLNNHDNVEKSHHNFSTKTSHTSNNFRDVFKENLFS